MNIWPDNRGARCEKSMSLLNHYTVDSHESLRCSVKVLQPSPNYQGSCQTSPVTRPLANEDQRSKHDDGITGPAAWGSPACFQRIDGGGRAGKDESLCNPRDCVGALSAPGGGPVKAIIPGNDGMESERMAGQISEPGLVFSA